MQVRPLIWLICYAGTLVFASPTPQSGFFGLGNLNRPQPTRTTQRPNHIAPAARITFYSLHPPSDNSHSPAGKAHGVPAIPHRPPATTNPRPTLLRTNIAASAITVPPLKLYPTPVVSPLSLPSSTVFSDPSPNTTATPGDAASLSGEEDNRFSLAAFKVVVSILGIVAAIAVVLFLLLDPRVYKACLKRANKSSGDRPISSWFPFPLQRGSIQSRKTVSYVAPEEFDASEKSGTRSSYPRSKFSVASSDFSIDQRSRPFSTASADTVLVENTRANTSTLPVRPPRPPTADSPVTISDSVFFAPENQMHMEPSLASTHFDSPLLTKGGDEGNPFVAPSESPLLPPSLFLTMPSPPIPSTELPTSDNQDPDTSKLDPQEEKRHSRRNSAPIFVGNPIDDSNPEMYMDPVARRVLRHRRSRSASGWAYPKRAKATEEEEAEEEEESYEGVMGQAI